MPIDYSKYPKNWKEISQHIRFERAQGRCESCGVRHGETIIREPGTANYLIFDIEHGYYCRPDGTLIKMSELPDFVVDAKETRVILTVHHIGVDKPDGTPGDAHDKMDCRDENLAALCQKCHLAADGPDNAKAATVTKAKKKHAALQAGGQRAMFGEVES